MSERFSQIQCKQEVEGWRLILGYLGAITCFAGAIILLPCVLLAAYPMEHIYARGFLIVGVSTIIAGLTLSLFIYKKPRGKLRSQQDALIVALAWLVTVVLCSLPYVVSGQGITFPKAVFEAASMWTTTGISTLEVTTTPKIFLLYQSLMQFFGGVGLILVALSFFSDSRLSKIFNAEGHSDKLLPNLKKTARTIFLIYSLYAFAGMLLYKAFGMSWFEAVNYSLCAVSTGGATCTVGGIAGFNSTGIEIVTVVLMLVGGTSFLVHLYLVRRKFKKVASSSEIRLFLGYILAFSCILALLAKSFRVGLFHTVSAVTGTGLVISSGMTSAIFLVLIFLMLVGGQNGSTSGGIKMHRLYIVLNDIWWSIRAKLGSQNVVRINRINRLGTQTVIEKQEKADTYNFVVLFLTLFLVVTFIVTLAGYSMEDAAFFTAACISNAGLSAGVVPSAAPNFVLWTGSAAMVLGRLEIYIFIFAVFSLGKSGSALFTKN